MRVRVVVAAWVVALAGHASNPTVEGHETRPALLEVFELSPGLYDILWKVPAMGGRPIPVEPVFPDACNDFTPYRAGGFKGARVVRFRLECGEKGLAGESIRIEGLASTLTSVLVRFEILEGKRYTLALHPSSPVFQVPTHPETETAGFGYLELGIKHILSGADHLLFVLGLILLVTGLRALLLTVTSFTVAHSITLGMASLGVIRFPALTIEVLISLSIVFLALEVIRKRADRATGMAKHPWKLAFVFGLLHGMGFAEALLKVGLPASEAIAGLFFFNLGVEAGQLIFVAGVGFLYLFSRQIYLPNALTMRGVMGCGIGIAGSF